MSKKQFPVLSPINHDGKHFKIGAKIVLDDQDQIDALQLAGAIGEEVTAKPETAAERKAREQAEADEAKRVAEEAAAAASGDKK